MRGSPNAATMAALWSEEPSSIAISSQFGNVCSWIERTAAPTVAAALRMDMMTETKGRASEFGPGAVTVAPDGFSLRTRSALGVKQPPRQTAGAIGRRAAKPPGQFIDQAPRRARTALSSEHQAERSDESCAHQAGDALAAVPRDSVVEGRDRQCPGSGLPAGPDRSKSLEDFCEALLVSMLGTRAGVTGPRDGVAHVRLIEKVPRLAHEVVARRKCRDLTIDDKISLQPGSHFGQ